MKEENMIKLNLGCGEDKKDGYLNIDWNPIVKPDITHDLNIVPYPFEDNYFDLIEVSHVLEHLEKPFIIMKELHRILKPNGKLIIKVPHFSRGMSHSEHHHGFDVTFPIYFNKDFRELGVSGYFGVDYKLEKVKLKWLAFLYILPGLGFSSFTISILRFFNIVVSFLANLNPYFCARIWCFWVGGFEEIYFELKCLK
jgi:SAM-dependent methyltransferase